MIAVLLFWAQMEPLVSSWFRKAPGWPTNAIERGEVTAVRQDLENRMKELEFAKTSLQLQTELQSLKAELQSLKSRVGGKR
jgi:hypothetical protein